MRKKNTSKALNGACGKGITKLNKAVKAKYNIPFEHFKYVSTVWPVANPNSLASGISVSYSPIPVIKFPNVDTRKEGVIANIRKDRATKINRAFAAKMASGHIGIFARGRYKKNGGFEYAKPGERKITELNTVSPAAMMCKDIGKGIAEFLGKELIRATEKMLDREVKKLTK